MNRCFYWALEYDNHELLQALIDWGFGDSIIPHKRQQLKGKDEQHTGKSKDIDVHNKISSRVLIARAARHGQFKILERLLSICIQ